MSKIIIAWNVVLTLIVGLLIWNMTYQGKSTYDIAQDTVLCGYVTDLQEKTNINTQNTPDCQGDIGLIFDLVAEKKN